MVTPTPGDGTGPGGLQDDEAGPSPEEGSGNLLRVGAAAVVAAGAAGVLTSCGDDDETTDVLIVGAGAAGGVLAAKLAEAGKSVVVIESGPAWKTTDLYSSQVWGRRLKWGPSVRVAGKNSLAPAFNYGWGLGGSALHHYANWFRLHEEDFEIRTRYGVGADWPISYDDLRPFYDRIQTEVGVSGDAEAEVWRPPGEPYPLPPHPTTLQGLTIKRGFDALGRVVSPLPQAILSRPYRGREGCRYDGWCDVGCSVGALANPLVTYIPAARRAGAEFRTNCHVTRVLTSGDRATGVEYADESGDLHTQEARVVILAAYALETPRILLNSAEGGLANSSGLVGSFMFGHPSVSVYGLFDEKTDPSVGIIGGTLLSQDRYDKDPKKGFYGGYQWLIGLASKPNDLIGFGNARPELFGADLTAFMQRAARSLGGLTTVGESLPAKDNGVSLTDQRDAFDLPLAQLQHSFSDDALRQVDVAGADGEEVLRAAGAKEVWRSGVLAQHIMGGVRMGSDEKASVTNGFGQTHDVSNLFVSGSSLFPTGGAVNPTFTVHAVALRTSDYLVDRWDDIA